MRRVICLASLPCPLYKILFLKITIQNQAELLQKIKKARQSNQWATRQKTYPEEEREESRVEGHGDNA